MESKYKKYSIEQFVEDIDFRKWVIAPDEITTVFWSNFREKYPEKTTDQEYARQIIENIHLDEPKVKQDHTLYILKQRLRARMYRKRIAIFARYAAAILILPLILFLYRNTGYRPAHKGQPVRYEVPAGQKSNLVLSDGTRVWLNSGSELIFNPYSRERGVTLKGEAFFQVAHDEHRPFMVHTGDYAVKVYGTAFNIRSYGETTGSEVVLQEGYVAVLTGDKEIELLPGQRFYMDEERKYAIVNVNVSDYTCWRENILRINNEPLHKFILRMERWYGVNINVEDFDRVKDLRYTLTIKAESLREMLQLMKFVTPFNYTINGENVVLKYD